MDDLALLSERKAEQDKIYKEIAEGGASEK
jgi:hypothetical protein